GFTLSPTTFPPSQKLSPQFNSKELSSLKSREMNLGTMADASGCLQKFENAQRSKATTSAETGCEGSEEYSSFAMDVRIRTISLHVKFVRLGLMETDRALKMKRFWGGAVLKGNCDQSPKGHMKGRKPVVFEQLLPDKGAIRAYVS